MSQLAGSGVTARHCSRGCAFGDFDNDEIWISSFSIAMTTIPVAERCYRQNHWIKVKLIGVKSNRSAIGARVTVEYGNKRQAQEVLAQ